MRYALLSFYRKYIIYCLFVFLLCSLPFVAGQSYAASSKNAPVDDGWNSWGSAASKDDEFWEKSVSGQTFLQTKGLKTDVTDTGREAREKLNAQKKKKSDFSFGKGVLTDQADVVSNQVAPKSPTERSLDENQTHHTHDVYGAYKDVVHEKDLEVKMGPEVHVPSNSVDHLKKGDAPSASDVGVGMKLKWGF